MTPGHKTLAAIPLEWTDLREVAKLLPHHATGPMPRVLDELIDQGYVETRNHLGRLQVRKVQGTKGDDAA